MHQLDRVSPPNIPHILIDLILSDLVESYIRSLCLITPVTHLLLAKYRPSTPGSKKVCLPPSFISQSSWSSNLVTSTDIEMHTTVLVQQTNAPWGLARLSSGATPLANKDPNALSFQYTFDDSAGSGTDAFILDMGCRVSHQEFGGRASCFPSTQPCADSNGHEYHTTLTISTNCINIQHPFLLCCSLLSFQMAPMSLAQSEVGSLVSQRMPPSIASRS